MSRGSGASIRVGWLGAALLAGAALGCGGATDGPRDAGGGDAGTDSAGIEDAGTEDAGPDDTGADGTDGFVESHWPDSASPVAINAQLGVTFVPSTSVEDYVIPDSVVLELDGEPARIWPYRRNAAGNREFHFVPFPVYEPNTTYSVTIRAGATYAGSQEGLAADFTWSFTTADVEFDEDYAPGATAPLDADELAAAAAGGATFKTADVLKDWDDAASTLHLVSEPVDPTDPDVQDLAAKLRDSLNAVGGIGLAAPQIGVNRRLFGARLGLRAPAAYVDPVILDWSAETYYWQNGASSEGCLSIPNQPAKVARPRWIRVSYYRADGSLVADETLQTNEAVTFLHEYDHLNGILITDRQEAK